MAHRRVERMQVKKRMAHPRMGRTLQLLVVAATTSAFVPPEAPSRPPPPLYANGERRRYYRQRFMGFLRLGRMAATSRETRPEAPLPPPASPAPEAPRVEHGEESGEKGGALTFSFGNWFTPKYKFDVEDRETHYGVLGLERTASPSEIKRNYRGLSRTCHPDVDPSEAGRAKWAAVTEAYETLRDERKREAYDGALAVNDLAESTEQFVDDVVVPFVRDTAAPVLGGFASAFGQTAQTFGGAVESFVDKARGGNISAASAVATAAGFAVAGPVHGRGRREADRTPLALGRPRLAHGHGSLRHDAAVQRQAPAGEHQEAERRLPRDRRRPQPPRRGQEAPLDHGLTPNTVVTHTMAQFLSIKTFSGQHIVCSSIASTY